MLIYLYSKCSTCQNALRFLAQKNVAFTTKEIVQEPPSFQELQRMLHYQNGNLKKLFNTSGHLYREMGISALLKEATLSQALTLLTQHGMLVKRPFLLGTDFGLVGFNEPIWSLTLPAVE